MPFILQAIVGLGDNVKHQDAFERKLLAIRKQTQNPLAEIARKQNLPELSPFYMPSFSSRTVVYKGLLLSGPVISFYADLVNPLAKSPLSLFTQRFSTTPFPSCTLSHPSRLITPNSH